MEEEHLRTASEEVRGVFQAAKKPVPELVDSRAWYASRFQTCGSLDSWALDAVTGRRYSDRQPHFHGFVLAGALEEEAATVALLALGVRKPVLFLDGESLLPVKQIRRDGTGWAFQTTKEGSRG